MNFYKSVCNSTDSGKISFNPFLHQNIHVTEAKPNINFHTKIIDFFDLKNSLLYIAQKNPEFSWKMMFLRKRKNRETENGKNRFWMMGVDSSTPNGCDALGRNVKPFVCLCVPAMFLERWTTCTTWTTTHLFVKKLCGWAKWNWWKTQNHVVSLVISGHYSLYLILSSHRAEHKQRRARKRTDNKNCKTCKQHFSKDLRNGAGFFGGIRVCLRCLGFRMAKRFCRSEKLQTYK